MVLERKPGKQASAYSIVIFYCMIIGIFMVGKWDVPDG